MKKLTISNSFMAILILFLNLSLISCNNNDDIPETIRLSDVKGNYKGEVIISQEKNSGQIIDFAVNNNTIVFNDFPIKEILQSVIKDSAKVDSAMAVIGKLKYELNYTPALNSDKNIIELDFVPKTLEIEIPVEGNTINASIALSTQQKGVYSGGSNALKFGLLVDKITVDGEPLIPIHRIYYDFPHSIKY